MPAEQDKAAAQFLTEKQILPRDEVEAAEAELVRRGASGLLELLLAMGKITAHQMRQARQAVQEAQASAADDGRKGRQPSALTMFSFGPSGQKRITRRPLPTVDDEAPTRPSGQLRPVSGPNPFASKAPPDRQTGSVPSAASEDIPLSAEPPADLPKASPESTGALLAALRSLTQLEQAILDDEAFSMTDRANLTTHVDKARRVLRDIQQRLT